jgi:hypothetical protein
MTVGIRFDHREQIGAVSDNLSEQFEVVNQRLIIDFDPLRSSVIGIIHRPSLSRKKWSRHRELKSSCRSLSVPLVGSIRQTTPKFGAEWTDLTSTDRDIFI